MQEQVFCCFILSLFAYGGVNFFFDGIKNKIPNDIAIGGFIAGMTSYYRVALSDAAAFVYA